MQSIDEILGCLQLDSVRNVNMINFINSYPISYIGKIEKSIIVKGISDREWVYISSESGEELKAIKGKLGRGDKCLAAIEDWMLPILTKGSKIKWSLSTLKLFLPQNISLTDNKYIVSDLRIEDSRFIYENSDYKEYISIEYIGDRIQKGFSSGIYESNRLVAWGMTQDDGAIGFLHVLPEFRLRGYGRSITIDLIKKVRRQGGLPFVHIEENNEKSMKLALSLGFTKDRIVNWFELE